MKIQKHQCVILIAKYFAYAQKCTCIVLIIQEVYENSLYSTYLGFFHIIGTVGFAAHSKSKHWLANVLSPVKNFRGGGCAFSH
eukprot:UN00247